MGGLRNLTGKDHRAFRYLRSNDPGGSTMSLLVLPHNCGTLAVVIARLELSPRM